MKTNSDAFIKLKEEQQRLLDFSKLVCYAVPNLMLNNKKYEIAKKRKSKLASPFHFKETIRIDNIKNISKQYKHNLSKYIVISSFSFFESYFVDVIRELISFHFGKDKILKFMKNKQQNYINNKPIKSIEIENKLKEPYRNIKKEKYVKLINELQNIRGYKFPSDLFSNYGYKQLILLIESDKFKSVMIPEILESCFLMNLNDFINVNPKIKSKNIRETFDYYRDLRNRIGHGKNIKELSFNLVMDLIRFVREFAVRIDNHLVNNYFIIENIS